MSLTPIKSVQLSDNLYAQSWSDRIITLSKYPELQGSRFGTYFLVRSKSAAELWVFWFCVKFGAEFKVAVEETEQITNILAFKKPSFAGTALWVKGLNVEQLEEVVSNVDFKELPNVESLKNLTDFDNLEVGDQVRIKWFGGSGLIHKSVGKIGTITEIEDRLKQVYVAFEGNCFPRSFDYYWVEKVDLPPVEQDWYLLNYCLYGAIGTFKNAIEARDWGIAQKLPFRLALPQILTEKALREARTPEQYLEYEKRLLEDRSLWFSSGRKA